MTLSMALYVFLYKISHILVTLLHKAEYIVSGVVLMNRKMLGVALTSCGMGMLVVIIIPWWGFIAAFIMALIGLGILFSNC